MELVPPRYGVHNKRDDGDRSSRVRQHLIHTSAESVESTLVGSRIKT